MVQRQSSIHLNCQRNEIGTDNLHHKRKAKKANDLVRNRQKRASYDKVLIVCEGEKTEPNYFRDLIKHYQINSANIAIDGTCGSSPKSVLRRAEQLYENEKCKGDAYDRVYCVFDRDSHESYDATLQKIASKRQKNVFYAATSVPSFEYWLLLHFNYTTKPFSATGTSSVGEMVVKALKVYLPNYEKGQTKVFSKLQDNLSLLKPILCALILTQKKIILITLRQPLENWLTTSRS